MICGHCQQAPATQHVTIVRDGMSYKGHFCEDCLRRPRKPLAPPVLRCGCGAQLVPSPESPRFPMCSRNRNHAMSPERVQAFRSARAS